MIRNDSEAFRQASADIGTAVHDAHSQIEKVRKECMDLVDVAWRGQASVAFGNLMEEYDRNAKELNAALDKMGELVGTSADLHENTDADQSTAVQHVMADMAGTGFQGLN
ncbi:WXG100 family type VII secretion target [Phytomonospora sp. NPDC050363]|uniref:WXG100 family type VII secretion target n=1 Tax=Phytomonospora sp. NPDC050363 TaxID=3155642 RepID=UPI0033FC0FB0